MIERFHIADRKRVTMQRFLNTVLRRTPVELDTPLCPEHGAEMRLRGKMGRPARFEDQIQETYTLIYFCPVHGCGETVLRESSRSQSRCASPRQGPSAEKGTRCGSVASGTASAAFNASRT